jgi:hypothetical protein
MHQVKTFEIYYDISFQSITHQAPEHALLFSTCHAPVQLMGQGLMLLQACSKVDFAEPKSEMYGAFFGYPLMWCIRTTKQHLLTTAAVVTVCLVAVVMLLYSSLYRSVTF